MKISRLTALIGIFMAAVLAEGQTSSSPTPPITNTPPGFNAPFNNLSNSYGYGTNFWWTNVSHLSNAPVRGSTNNQPGHVIPPTSGNTGSGTGSSRLPTEVQAIVNQFQHERGQLMQNLNSADDAERQAILQQLETLREQLITQVANIRDNLQQQTLEMQGQFNNSFGPITRGVGSGNGSGNGNGNGGGVHKH
jgi:hypothetical protein